jgi:hypothetical protein
MNLLEKIQKEHPEIVKFYLELVGASVSLFNETGSENYLELEFINDTSGEEFTVIIQKKTGETPASKNMKMEKILLKKDLEIHHLDNSINYYLKEVSRLTKIWDKADKLAFSNRKRAHAWKKLAKSYSKKISQLEEEVFQLEEELDNFYKDYL